jgi:hypothetical protein
MSGRKCPAARIGLFDIVRDDQTKCPRVGFLAEQSHRRVGPAFVERKPPRAGPRFGRTKRSQRGGSWFWENEAKPTRWILVLGERSEANEVAPGFGRTKRSQRGGSWFWENKAKPKRAGSWFWPNKPTGRNRAWGGPYLIASGLRSRQASAISESLLRLHRARAVPSPASHVCPRLLPMQTTAPTEKTLLL